jgi:hypothetical protein
MEGRILMASIAIKEVRSGYFPSRIPRHEKQPMKAVASFPTTVVLDFVEPTPLSVQQMMLALREGGMPISAIADAMAVERKTIYAWMDGGEARKEHLQRAGLIHSLLTATPDVDVRSLYRFWNTPVSGEKTLRDLMTADTINEPVVRPALKALLPAARRARNLEEKMARKGAGNPVLDELPEVGERV